MKPYQELLTFIAESGDPEKLAKFRPSKAAQARVEALVEKQKDGTLRKADREELEMFFQFEHVMRLAKATTGARSAARAA